jgi:hypothetical protein
VEWEELQQGFVDAGWGLDASFEDYLLIGHDSHHISILAHKEGWNPHNPTFELIDHEEMSTYWVYEVPAPQHAAQLLQEHSQLSEEWTPEEQELP